MVYWCCVVFTVCPTVVRNHAIHAVISKTLLILKYVSKGSRYSSQKIRGLLAAVNI